MENPQPSQNLQHYAYAAFYNTNGFWDGFVCAPDGELPSEASEIIRNIFRRQLVIPSTLARRPAKKGKQVVKTKAYKVQKQTVERNLLSKSPEVHAHQELHTSQAPGQHDHKERVGKYGSGQPSVYGGQSA
ncbi:hypothetical protein NCS56_01541900 [Fusarium sp. Ph1]|nr:hypothetical protein NCS56_01541900 [Fusarium sp. Ph1]